MKKEGKVKKTTLFLMVMMIISSLIHEVRGAGESGGISMLDHGSARASGLAEAYSAATDDITAMQFNPASLPTLSSNEASFFYEKGLEGQSKGRIHLGMPHTKWSTGLAVGYFDGGSFEMVDGAQTRTVTSQRDLTVALGGAVKLGRMNLGLAGKYLSSQLAETEKASTVALDLGFQWEASKKLRFAGTAQNFGPGLKYRSERDNLPRTIRGGLNFSIPTQGFKTNVFADLPYLLNEQDFQQALGVEMGFGMIALRGGVARRFGEMEWTVGTGLGLGKFSLDYGMTMLSHQLSAQHLMNVSMHFGGHSQLDFVKAVPALSNPSPVASAMIMQQVPSKTVTPGKTIGAIDQNQVQKIKTLSKSRIYVVKAGDTLASIAKEQYGKKELWARIYKANAHLMENPNSLTEGQKIVLPASAE